MDFNDLYHCFKKESFNDPILKSFLHHWLPKKVRYLANETAATMGTKLRNDDYEEITGQLILLVFEKIDKIEPGIPFRSWICQAIKFLAKNFIRKKKEALVDTTENNNPIFIEKDKEYINSKNSSLTDRQQEKLYDAIQSLPSNSYRAFILKYDEGYSSKEIANLLGWTVSQVDQRNHKTKKKLQAVLNKYFPDYKIKGLS
ncbi:RNA polymerase sigma factor [Ornithinibacillus contaminans]|uniref:RNA polymerase sigma factor n=1 Tax=Ornithinibacillus contaminans TaxID=694055 RepID=UPI00064DA140|nr:sigma-70 family RNA polymerase sigma factor [Ornithinibacillus contaminans]